MKKTMIECGKTLLMCMTAMLLPCQYANAEDAWQGWVNGYKWMDVGTSMLWATRNVGAADETQTGFLFAWGETATKSTYAESNYKYYSGGYYTKYTKTDGLKILLPADDAASVNMGGPWRMPTVAEGADLRNKCVIQYTFNYNNTGVAGVIVYKAKADSDKGKTIGVSVLTETYAESDIHIFFPAKTAYYEYPGQSYKGTFMTSSRSMDNDVAQAFSYNVSIKDGNSFWGTSFPYRYQGNYVRGVISKEDWDEMLTDVRDAEKSENTVWRSGEWLFVSCNEAVQRIEVLSLDGKMLLSQEISGNKVQLPVSERNVLVRLVDKNGKVSVHKVM